MSETYDPELVARMMALVREQAATRCAGDRSSLFMQRDKWMTEARAIVADLPAPVDPDLLEAREIAASHSCKGAYISIPAGEQTAKHIRQGLRDDDVFVQALAAALRRGRELVRGEA